MAGLLTVGHGTLAADALTALLQGAGVRLLVDVRRYPGSRAHPDLARDELAARLPAAGVGYRWEVRLGGRRGAPADRRDADRWWRVQQFRGYAVHTRTPEFRAALAELLAEAAETTTAVMCSEAVWWRCHRRLIADVVRLTTGTPVTHLSHDGRLSPHPVADGARLAGQDVVWDGERISGGR